MRSPTNSAFRFLLQSDYFDKAKTCQQNWHVIFLIMMTVILHRVSLHYPVHLFGWEKKAELNSYFLFAKSTNLTKLPSEVLVSVYVPLLRSGRGRKFRFWSGDSPRKAAFQPAVLWFEQWCWGCPCHAQQRLWISQPQTVKCYCIVSL